jgi:SagB-type dehydrogenase family enzyme
LAESDSISYRNALACEAIAKLLKNSIPNRTQSLSYMFHEQYPVAWSFHCNTYRWRHNALSIKEDPSCVASFKEYLGTELICLPEPITLSSTLQDCIASRVSCRHFSDEAMNLSQLSTLANAAYGIKGRSYSDGHELLERPVPSGGGLYPLELYFILRNVEKIDSGVYHYAPLVHGLETIRRLEVPRQFLSEIFLWQPYVGDASMVVFLAAVLERSLWKYTDRGYRYVLFEAGHVAQNVNLVAESIGLGSLNLGGFFDDEIAALLDIDTDEEVPLYGTALGVPAHRDQSLIRRPEVIGDY